MTERKNVFLTNKMKEKLARGEVVIGCGVGLEARNVEMAGLLGFDFVRFEGEHGPITYGQLDHFVAVAHLVGVTPTARVPGNVQHEILHYLDLGVLGVTIPHTASRAGAEAAVWAAKHTPIGGRGDNFHGKLARYGTMGYTQKEYYEAVNQATLVTALIEDQEGLENVEEIVTTPGVDSIDIGPLDLAQSMGLPDPKEVDDAVVHIVEVAVRAGKPVGVGGSANPKDPDKIRFWLAKGCRYFLGGCSRELIAVVRQLQEELGIP
jgi:2-keto-3-deoxy-L-rhamnonate aldolase RhmA